MFPSTCCVVSTVAWTIMMMMMSASAAILKADNQTGAAVKSALETVTLELDPGLLYPSQTVQQLQNRSISPWTYEWQDAAIFPPVSEARCVLVGCLDHHGAEDAGLRSRPILHQVTLLRRVESPGGRRRYRLEPRLVAVGCTCVRDAVWPSRG